MSEGVSTGSAEIISDQFERGDWWQEAFVFVLKEAEEKIEAMDHAGAFAGLLSILEKAEKQPGLVESSEFQKKARYHLRKIWEAVVRDIKDRKKFGKRLDATKAFKNLDSSEKRKNESLPVSPDERKYGQALREQRQKVAVFPNRASEDAAFKRNIGEFIDSKIEDSPSRQGHLYQMAEMSYIAALYNDILPLLFKNTEGYVKPLIDGKSEKWNITARKIRHIIFDFFAKAPELAEELGKLSRGRDDVVYPVT